MDSLTPQLTSLTDQIDTLTTALQPLLAQPLTASTSKQPLLDKAKTYVLATYALESILFTSLRLSGTDAKNHPVFEELKRVKEYFGKITAAENIGAGGGARGRLDKEAAGRFVKAGLSGNDRYDAERKEREGRERAGAKRKLEAMGTHTRFEEAPVKKTKAGEGESVSVVRAEDLDEDDEEGQADAEMQQDGEDQDDGEDAIAALEETLTDSASAPLSRRATAALRDPDGGPSKKQKRRKNAKSKAKRAG